MKVRGFLSRPILWVIFFMKPPVHATSKFKNANCHCFKCQKRVQTRDQKVTATHFFVVPLRDFFFHKTCQKKNTK
jgi:hypothetical protein